MKNIKSEKDPKPKKFNWEKNIVPTQNESTGMRHSFKKSSKHEPTQNAGVPIRDGGQIDLAALKKSVQHNRNKFKISKGGK